MTVINLKTGPHDYPKDFSMENGQYWNRCSRCEKGFIGHKRRAICKVCRDEAQAEWDALSKEEQQELQAKANARIRLFFAKRE